MPERATQIARCISALRVGLGVNMEMDDDQGERMVPSPLVFVVVLESERQGTALSHQLDQVRLVSTRSKSRSWEGPNNGSSRGNCGRFEMNQPE